MRNSVIIASTLYILAGLVLLPDVCINAGLYGINLCLTVVIPSLFPFFICARLLIGSGFAEAASRPLRRVMRPLFNVPACGAAAFVLGILSGYPLGAKCAADLYQRGCCTKAEGERMLCFCNNSGPLFIIGSVAAGFLGSKDAGRLLYLSHVLSALAVGLVMRFYKRRERIGKELAPAPAAAFNISEAVSDSVSVMGYVCGFILFFSVALAILQQSGLVEVLGAYGASKGVARALLYGALEMTNGVAAACALPAGSMRLVLISGLIGFSGLSVILQVAGIVRSSGFSVRLFVLAKALQGLFSALFTYLLLLLPGGEVSALAPAAVPVTPLGSWAYSIKLIAAAVIIFLILSIIEIVCKFLRRM